MRRYCQLEEAYLCRHAHSSLVLHFLFFPAVNGPLTLQPPHCGSAGAEVTSHGLFSTYTTCLLYGLECYTLPKSSLRSLDFVVVRFLMKLFKTVNNEIIRECCSYFKFPLPSELLDKRRDKFQSNFMLCTGILHYFGINS